MGKREDGDDGMNVDEDMEIKLVDRFTPHLVVRASGKIRSFDFGPDNMGHKGGVQVSEDIGLLKPSHLQIPVALYGIVL